MRSPKLFVALPLIAIVAVASAQAPAPSAYSDATTVGEAMQALSGSEIASDAMLHACSQRFPEGWAISRSTAGGDLLPSA